MSFKRALFLICSFSLVFWSLFALPSGNQKVSAQVQQIDDEILELEDMKRGYESRALKHESMAEYLQFEQQAVLETRRHLQLADENREKAAKVQERIDFLQAKKRDLLNQ